MKVTKNPNAIPKIANNILYFSHEILQMFANTIYIIAASTNKATGRINGINYTPLKNQVANDNFLAHQQHYS
jgi:hypothetical protein